MHQPGERGLVLMFGRTLRRVLKPEVLDTIVERGPDATEWVQIEAMVFPLYVVSIGDRRGYLATAEPPTEDQAFLAACELFGNIGRAVPEVHRVRRGRTSAPSEATWNNDSEHGR